MPEGNEATPAGGYQPPAGSLEEGAMRMLERLSDPSDTEPSALSAPEQPTRTAEPTKQEPAAPEAKAEESEQAESESTESSEQTEDEQPDPTPLYTVKVDGKEERVTLDEALRGYSRTQNYTRDKMALADERKAFETEKANELKTVRAERDQYAELLPQLKQAIAALSTEPDWSQRALEVAPVQLAEEMRQWKAAQERVKALDAEAQRVKAQQEAEAADALKHTLAKEQQALLTVFPDLAEPEKARAIWAGWQQYASDLGFTPEQFAGVTDHRVLAMLNDAMLYRQQQKKAPAIQNKITQKIASAAPGGEKTTPSRSKAAEAAQRARKSGRVEDAAAAIEHLL